MEASARKAIRMLVAFVVILTVSVVLFRNIMVAYGLPVLAAQTSAVTASAGKNSGMVPGIQGGVGIPVRIRIPRVRLSAAIEQVALAADGSMGTPKYPRNAAWYALGPRPGEIGSAAIAGHVNWLYGATGAFANLHKVRPGDTVTVQDDEGAVVAFTVREVRDYDAAADASDVFVSHDGKSHLNLITCIGTWDKRARQYTKRLVVFADKME